MDKIMIKPIIAILALIATTTTAFAGYETYRNTGKTKISFNKYICHYKAQFNDHRISINHNSSLCPYTIQYDFQTNQWRR